MKYHRVLAIILALQLCHSIRAAPMETEDENISLEQQYRLPKDIVPSHYDILIKPYILKAGNDKIKQFQFEGKITITLAPKIEKLKKIVLHRKNMTISSTELVSKKEPETQIKIFKQDHNETTDLWTINLENDLVKDTDYLLKILYVGEMLDDMKGFYKSSYKNDKNATVYLGSTQFQTHYARRAFPCFDEPAFKAIFDITINHEKEFTTVASNTKLKKPAENDGEDRMITTFQSTPIMSTYLIAFLVSEFKGPKEGDKFSVLARPEYESQTKYSFEEGQKILKALGQFFDLPYDTLGNPKMDMAAIPDFSAGAMENWGLLTYRERALLYDPNETTDIAQQRIALVIAHEQTHMWFGDYVTCNWWNVTWLNEGFARHFQYFTPDKIYQNWDLAKQFVVDNIHTVMVTDSLKNTHALSEKNINTQSDLRKMFDTISYSKGAAIIRQFRNSMGEDNFQKAIRKYLKDNKHSSTTPDMLFKAFDNEWKPTNVNTTQYYLDWTEQVGYPVIRVKVVDGGKKIEVSQERYLLEEDAGDKDLKYTIPFTYTTQKDPKFSNADIKYIKNNESISLAEKEHLSDSDYVIANIEQMGFYRVLYEENMWHNIHHALNSDNFGKIGELNRAHLIDDIFNFGRSGHLKYDLIFNVLSYLEKEIHYIPWAAAFSGFKNIETRLGKETDDLKHRLHKILPKVYDHLKFNQSKDESRLDTYNRASVLNWACKYEYKDCIDESNKLFGQFRNDTTKSINKNIRSVVYCSAIRRAENDENYEFLVKHYIETKIPTEKTLVLNALGCVKQNGHIEKYYKFILGENVRKQDRLTALNTLITENPENSQHVFNLIEKNHIELEKALVGGEDDVASVILTIASHFNSEEQKKSLEAFADKLSSKSAKETVQKAVEKVNKNKAWVDTYRSDLIKGLRGGVAAKAFSAVLITFTTILLYVVTY